MVAQEICDKRMVGGVEDDTKNCDSEKERRTSGRPRVVKIKSLVKWEGHGDKHDSWINEVGTHDDLIKDYDA